MRRLAIVLLLLVAIAAGADRGAAYLAARQVAMRVQAREHLSQRPGVDIRGFPFLTQVRRGRYDDVVVDIHGLQRGSVHVTRLLAHLYGVRLPWRAIWHHTVYDIHVDSGTAQVFLSYRDIDQALGGRGLTVTYAGGTDVKVAGSVSVLGQTLSASGTGAAAVHGDEVTVTVSQVQASASGVGSASLGARLSFSLPLPALPFGVRLTGVSADAAGIELSATASAFTLPG